MAKSLPVVIASLVHSLFAFVIVPVVAIPRWSGFTFYGIAATVLFFSIHALGLYGILRRLKWGYTFSRWVFGFYMVTSGFGFLLRLARRDIISIAEGAIFFAIFIWLFMRFRSDPNVRTYFER